VGVIVDIFDSAAVGRASAMAVGIAQLGEQVAIAVGRDLSGDGGTAAELTAGIAVGIHGAHAALPQRVSAPVVDMLLR